MLVIDEAGIGAAWRRGDSMEIVTGMLSPRGQRGLEAKM